MYYSIQTEHACKHLPMGFYRPPQVEEHLNYNERPGGIKIDTILIHYTVSDYAKSYYLLGHSNGGRPGPSVHYMINADGRIDSLVDDSKVAWHAGKSSWNGEKSVNSRSIGIELINPGSGEQGCFPVGKEKKLSSNDCIKNSFPDKQIEVLIQLISCLRDEHKMITEHNIIGHSDVAPGRKIDPGVEFPWNKLYEQGIGLYSSKMQDTTSVMHKFEDKGSDIVYLKENLRTFGYSIDNSTEIFDQELANVVRAFHLHFNQNIEEQNTEWGDWNSIDELRLQDLLEQIKYTAETKSYDEL